MNLLTSTIAAVSTTAFLTGTTASAEGNSVNDMIAQLKLPVGDTAIYFNAATQNVIVEKCEMGAKSNSVVCDLSVYGNEAIMQYDYLGMTYSLDEAGKVQVTPGTLSQGGWDTESDFGIYKSLKKQGTQAEWAASSPLASVAEDGTVIQNNVRVTKMIGEGEYRAEAFSAVPVSESRGINLRQSFEDKASAQSNVEMTVSYNGAVVKATGDTASRDYTDGDYDVVEKYYNASQKPYYKFE